MPGARGGGKDAIYRRGRFWLGWDERADGTRRSPYLAVFWYDPGSRRIRSASTGTADDDAARRVLDARYLAERGHAVCAACHQPIERRSALVMDALADYLVMKDDPVLRARVAPLVEFFGRGYAGLTIGAVGEREAEAFRAWDMKRAIVSPTGKRRARAPGTTENSLIALAAACRIAEPDWRGFRLRQPRELHRTPTVRIGIEEFARAFEYALARPDRVNLLKFLRLSLGTLCRPDAAVDVSTAPARRQWHPEARVLALNPHARAQTRKYRATVRVPAQLARDLNRTEGRYMPGGLPTSAWVSMAASFGWPRDGQYGMKLVRRSGAQLIRAARVPRDEIELQLGHRQLSATTDLYAPFDPDYLARACAALEATCAAIEAMVPNAFGARE